MDKKYIEQTVNSALIAEFELEPSKVVPSARIRDDLELDSLDIVDMVMALEEAFQFKLQDRTRILDIRTIQDIYDFIETLGDNRQTDGTG